MHEREIIDLLMARDERGIEELLKHYGPLMRYIIAPILSNAQDREDCLSESAMLVWDKISLYQAERGSWSAWLTALTRNAALNRLRQCSRCGSIDDIPPDTPSPEPSPEELVLRKERQEALCRVLDHHISYKEKTLFYRKYYYMQSTAQIASELGITERAVEGRLYRLKKRLRRLLGGDGFES